MAEGGAQTRHAGIGAGAGTHVLGLLAKPLHVRILRAHGEESSRVAELVASAGWAPPTTVRTAVRKLCGAGLLERRKTETVPYAIVSELTEGGREALAVADALARWLQRAPSGPIEPESDGAKEAIKALADGWRSTIVWELARDPASLTELDRRIEEVSYPSLERRLSRMRSIRQVEPAGIDGRGTPYEVTDWLREAIGPMATSVRCERRWLPAASVPVTALDVEAAFLLALPLVELPVDLHGACVLSVVPEAQQKQDGIEAVGVTLVVDRGQIVRCEPRLEISTSSWALGKPMAWLNAVIDGTFEELRFGGARPQLPMALVRGLHQALFLN